MGKPEEPTLTASPNPSPVGGVVTFSGDGYPDGAVMINIEGAMTPDRSVDGHVSHDWPYFSVAGTYSAYVYWKKGGRTVKGPVATVVVE